MSDNLISLGWPGLTSKIDLASVERNQLAGTSSLASCILQDYILQSQDLRKIVGILNSALPVASLSVGYSVPAIPIGPTVSIALLTLNVDCTDNIARIGQYSSFRSFTC